ncbi:COG0863 DNA modification methylase [uncultured Caudovirales phage]|uniref:COG0863 DNA modification methylase n=1 Tax=uncultured Caudovirales phage TaxID=2100421 RepID=A0A6J5SVU8_9CAUD|nr:COG0863 DNA modification methylase [uncultured Caudovirales phage]
MDVKIINILLLERNSGQIEGLPKNPRFIKDENYRKLIISIKEHPEMLHLREQIVFPFRSKFVVIAGNMKLLACTELEYKDMPCKVLPASTPPEKLRAYAIKDNISYGADDWTLIAKEWSTDELKHWGKEIQLPKGLEILDDGFEIPDHITTDIVVGDFFEIGPHRLLCGSSTDPDSWARLMGNRMIDLMLTDPPYNVNYQGKTAHALKIINDKMSSSNFYQFLFDFYTSAGLFVKPGGAWYIWHADSEGHNFRQAFIDAGNKLAQTLIWKKNTFVMGRQDYQWQHEPCLYGWKTGAGHKWFSDRKQATILEFDKPTRNADHPTMKPVPLFAYQISNSSKPGEIVADGFLGSGTTMVTSHQLDRRCYGLELDPKYCQVIINRMLKLDPNINIKKNGARYEQVENS